MVLSVDEGSSIIKNPCLPYEPGQKAFTVQVSVTWQKSCQGGKTLYENKTKMMRVAVLNKQRDNVSREFICIAHGIENSVDQSADERRVNKVRITGETNG